MDLKCFYDEPAPTTTTTTTSTTTALLVVDIFARHTQVVAANTPHIPDVLHAIKTYFAKMCGTPITLYSEPVGAFVSNAGQSYFRNNNMPLFTTLGQVSVAERQTTIQDVVHQRIEHK